jgi:hypothetical protein
MPNSGVPSVPGLGIDNILGNLDSQFLYGTGVAPSDPPSNPAQSPDVNNGLVSDLTAISGSPSVTLTNVPSVGEVPNAPGSGAVNAPQEDGTSHTQNLVRPSP